MMKNKIVSRKCDQCATATAVVYAGGRSANDWAGYYCLLCKDKLKFFVFDKFPNGIPSSVKQQTIQPSTVNLKQGETHGL